MQGDLWQLLALSSGMLAKAVEGLPAEVSLYKFPFPECREGVEAAPGLSSGSLLAGLDLGVHSPSA